MPAGNIFSWVLWDYPQLSPLYICNASFFPPLQIEPSFSSWSQCCSQGKGLLHFTVKLSLSRIIFLSMFSKIIYHWAHYLLFFLFCDFWLISAVLPSCKHILKTTDYLSPDFTENRICICLFDCSFNSPCCLVYSSEGERDSCWILSSSSFQILFTYSAVYIYR